MVTENKKAISRRPHCIVAVSLYCGCEACHSVLKLKHQALNISSKEIKLGKTEEFMVFLDLTPLLTSHNISYVTFGEISKDPYFPDEVK